MAEFKANNNNNNNKAYAQEVKLSSSADDNEIRSQVRIPILLPPNHKNQGVYNKTPSIYGEQGSHGDFCFDLRNSAACTNEFTTKQQQAGGANLGQEEMEMLEEALFQSKEGGNLQEAHSVQVNHDQKRAESKEVPNKSSKKGKVNGFNLEECWFNDVESVRSNYSNKHITCNDSILSDISLMFTENMNDEYVIMDHHTNIDNQQMVTYK